MRRRMDKRKENLILEVVLLAIMIGAMLMKMPIIIMFDGFLLLWMTIRHAAEEAVVMSAVLGEVKKHITIMDVEEEDEEP